MVHWLWGFFFNFFHSFLLKLVDNLDIKLVTDMIGFSQIVIFLFNDKNSWVKNVSPVVRQRLYNNHLLNPIHLSSLPSLKATAILIASLDTKVSKFSHELKLRDWLHQDNHLQAVVDDAELI